MSEHDDAIRRAAPARAQLAWVARPANKENSFIVVHVAHNNVGVYQVQDKATGTVRSCYTFERCALEKAAQLNERTV